MLDQELVAEVLRLARTGGADWAELFMEDTVTTKLHTLNGQVKAASNGNDYGAGLRLLYGTKVVYGFTNDCTRAGLLEVVRTLTASQDQGEVDQSGSGGLSFCRLSAAGSLPVRDHPFASSKRQKLDLALRAYHAAQVGQVKTTDVTFSDVVQRILIANTDSDWVEDERIRSRLFVSTIAQDGEHRATGYCGPGASLGTEFFGKVSPESIGAEAARRANAMLRARPTPAGRFPVVVGNGFGGVIFHEACGHSLETTAVEKNASVFGSKLGERVAQDCVTAIDDGTLPGAWGSLRVDDEATPGQRTVLIEKGILKSYMVDRVGELKTGYARTGSGRRQNYTFAPASRMRSTFIANGDQPPEALIESVSYGLYARTMGGGSVNPATGDYNFMVDEAYVIRNGEVQEPVRGASLVGNGAQDLLNIVGVANDLDHGAGMCGSVSGSVPTDCGQPHLLVSEITVGGQA